MVVSLIGVQIRPALGESWLEVCSVLEIGRGLDVRREFHPVVGQSSEQLQRIENLPLSDNHKN
jgi:hypothetical protein